SEVCAFVGVVGGDGPDVLIIGSVRVGLRTVAGKRDDFAVGRPGGFFVVGIARRDLAGRFVGQSEGIGVGAAAVEIADLVPFELQTVDHPGLLRFGFLPFVRIVSALVLIFVFVFGGFEFFVGGVAQEECEAG